MSRDLHSGDEKRQFLRLDFRTPVKFRSVKESEENLQPAQTQNVSASGVLFKSHTAPPLQSVIWMELDPKMLEVCHEMEQHVLIYQDGLLGRVVRVEEEISGESVIYKVGVCFIRKDEVNYT